MRMHYSSALLIAISVASGLPGCGAGTDAHEDGVVGSKALVGATPVEQTPSRGTSKRPPSAIERSPFSGQHFDNHAWLGTPVPAPQSSALGPLDRLGKVSHDALAARIASHRDPDHMNDDPSSADKELHR